MPAAVPDTINALWFLPTFGDGRYLGSPESREAGDFPYLKQIAVAADSLGFEGVLIPTGRSCEDSWLIASALAPLTERLRFLVAVRPGVLSPTQAARMTATLDRLSGGRVLINVVSGGDPQENRGDGLFWSHAERYRATEEFLNVYRRILLGEPVTFSGEFIRVEDARSAFPTVQRPYPPLYFGGSSEAAHDVASRTIDKYLSWGEPPKDVAAKFEDMRRRAENAGRKVTLGVRLHVIVRETNDAAWAEANRLIEKLDDATIAASQQVFARMDSVGQKRMSELHGGRRDRLEISPNLWAGVGLVRGGAGTALVGDPDTVAERMTSIAASGPTPSSSPATRISRKPIASAELLLPRLPLERPVASAEKSRQYRAVRRNSRGDPSPAGGGAGMTYVASRPPTIAIVGGGFSGSAAAYHLAADGAKARILVFEPRGRLGAGLAYGGADPTYRINVPATRMSLLPGDETHFARWLETSGALANDPDALSGSDAFPTRPTFSRYVEDALRPFLSEGRIVHVEDRVISAARTGRTWTVGASRGASFLADLLVIATTHPKPSVRRRSTLFAAIRASSRMAWRTTRSTPSRPTTV